MKKVLVAGFAFGALMAPAMVAPGVVAPALAADMSINPPYYTKAPPVAPVYNWSGWYIGGNAGYAYGAATNPSIGFDGAPFGPYFAAGGNVFPNLAPKGFIGGAQIGADQQWGNFVGGLVADFQGAGITASGAATVTPPGFVPSTQSLSQRLDFMGTVRAKAGFAWNNLLFYGTGGFAYGQDTSALTFNAPGALPAQILLTGSNPHHLVGWTAGGGVNYAFYHWVVGVEYLHYDLGTVTDAARTVAPGVILPGITLTASQRVAGDIVRGTLNYKFDWWY
jgi:outer membrane immunogenic protein